MTHPNDFFGQQELDARRDTISGPAAIGQYPVGRTLGEIDAEIGQCCIALNGLNTLERLLMEKCRHLERLLQEARSTHPERQTELQANKPKLENAP